MNLKVVETDSAILPGYASYGIHGNHMASTASYRHEKKF